MELDVEKEFETLVTNSQKNTTSNIKKRNYGTFNSFDLSQALLKAIKKKGFKTPTPIQKKVIPLMMSGADVLGMARTGSGKSGAFLIPILNKLHLCNDGGEIQCIIVAPTRELCLQLMKFTKEFGYFTSLKVAIVVGGDKMEDQFSAIHEKPNIIIATPGRLLHLVVEMNLKLSNVSYFVMDEADIIMESGLITQLKDILRRLPKTRQSAFFSATLPSSLVEFSKAGLRDPTLLRLDTENKISPTVTNTFLYAREEQRVPLLVYLLTKKIEGNTVVFAQTRHHVDYLYKVLQIYNINASFAYGSLDQANRRMQLENFRRCKTRVMIVTDLAARGLDLPFLDNAINFYFPTSGKLYVHRVGRVGRCGRVGNAYSIVTPLDMPYLFDLMLFLGCSLKLSDEGSDNLLGTVPQSVIDECSEGLETAVDSCPDLLKLQKCAANSNIKLTSHRALPSPASVRRSKEFDKSRLKCHPIFVDEISCSEFKSEENKREILDGIRNFKPKNSMLELINKQKKEHSKSFSQAISSFSRHKMACLVPTVFDSCREVNVPKDFHSEKGLELDMKFHKDTGDAAFDLAVKEEPRRPKSKMKWDRKKAKFVSANKQHVAKIKTESGTYIDASYKTDLFLMCYNLSRYKNWLKTQSDSGTKLDVAGNIQIYGHQKFRNVKKKSDSVVQSELKDVQKIMKERRMKEKKQKKTKRFKSVKKSKGRR